MKRILVTGAGGAPALNFVRSLRMAQDSFYTIGVDCDKYYLQRAETDERHLVPPAGTKEYLPVVKQIIAETRAELIFTQTDVELEILSEHRNELPLRHFWPAKETVRTCMNKYESFLGWKNAGLKVPETMLIQNEKDLVRAFHAFDGDIWLRNIKGAFGKDSLPVNSIAHAKAWLDLKDGWGDFTAAERLTERSVTWQSIWNRGELVVAQGRIRLYWEFANRSPSGVTGITGTGVTCSDCGVDTIAQKAILAIDPAPHGIFSVDMTYDKKGIPNPTEINIGRFFTTHLFFSTAGLNMPYIFVKLAFGEECALPGQKFNPLEPGLAWVRGMDKEPVLTNLEAINGSEAELEARIARAARTRAISCADARVKLKPAKGLSGGEGGFEVGSPRQLDQGDPVYNSREDFEYHLNPYNFALISPHLSGGPALELGCANGVMTELLVERVSQLVVVDRSPEYLTEVSRRLADKQHVHYVCSLFEDFEPLEQFDDIIMVRSLEHIAEPVRLLRRIAGWLAPGARLHIVVPNAFSLNRRLGVAMGMLKDCHDLHERDLWLGHKRVYDLELLKSHIEAGGLELARWVGCFLKPLSNAQMLDWDTKILDALFEVGKEFQDACAEIYVRCGKGK